VSDTRLHQLLAVESSLSNQADKTSKDLLGTFHSKRHLFEEKKTTFTPNTESAHAVVESQSDIQTTVLGELGWIGKILAKAMDASYMIHVGNSQAKADIVLEDGTILLREVPATALLELEKTLRGVQDLVSKIPTLDPAKGFRPDDSRGVGIYQAREVEKTRTKKTKRPITLYEATDKHPAQVQLIEEDIPVGTIRELEWSALMTPSDKADMLGRAEQLVRAVKAARSRANEQTVNTSNKIAADLLQYVFGSSVRL
jgi:hypothetical protein